MIRQKVAVLDGANTVASLVISRRWW